MRDIIIESALRIDPSLHLMKRAYYRGTHSDIMSYLTDVSYLKGGIRRHASAETLKTEFRKVNEGTYKSKTTGNDVKWTTAYNQGNPKAVKDFKSWAAKQVEKGGDEGSGGGASTKLNPKESKEAAKTATKLIEKHGKELGGAVGAEGQKAANALLTKMGTTPEKLLSSPPPKPKTEGEKQIVSTFQSIGKNIKSVADASKALKGLSNILQAKDGDEINNALTEAHKDLVASVGAKEDGALQKTFNVLSAPGKALNRLSSAKTIALTTAIPVIASGLYLGATGAMVGASSGAGAAAGAAIMGAVGAAIAAPITVGVGAALLTASAVFGKDAVANTVKKLGTGTATVLSGAFADVSNMAGKAKDKIKDQFVKKAALMEIKYKYQTNPAFRRALMRELTRD